MRGHRAVEIWKYLGTPYSRTFSDQNGKMTDQVPICLDMNPISFLLCSSTSYHARTECPTKTQSLFPALPVDYLCSYGLITCLYWCGGRGYSISGIFPYGCGFFNP